MWEGDHVGEGGTIVSCVGMRSIEIRSLEVCHSDILSARHLSTPQASYGKVSRVFGNSAYLIRWVPTHSSNSAELDDKLDKALSLYLLRRSCSRAQPYQSTSRVYLGNFQPA